MKKLYSLPQTDTLPFVGRERIMDGTTMGDSGVPINPSEPVEPGDPGALMM